MANVWVACALLGMGAQLRAEEATTSSHTFAKQATGVDWAGPGRNLTDHTQPQN